MNLFEKQPWVQLASQGICAVPQGCLRFVIVVFPDHTHLLFSIQPSVKYVDDLKSCTDLLMEYSGSAHTLYRGSYMSVPLVAVIEDLT